MSAKANNNRQAANKAYAGPTATEEARAAVMGVVGPRRPPGPQTLKRPLTKVGETPQTPYNTFF